MESNYHGVSYHESSNEWQSHLTFQGKYHDLGRWTLKSDAARMNDEAMKLFDSTPRNFTTHQDYRDARKEEISRMNPGATIDSLMSVRDKILMYISRIPCPQISALNDAMAKKWARYLSVDTGRDLVDSYQASA